MFRNPRRLAEAEPQAVAEEEQAEKGRAERAARYDPERAQTRLELLEAQGLLGDEVRERDEILSGEVCPGMDHERRQKHPGWGLGRHLGNRCRPDRIRISP